VIIIDDSSFYREFLKSVIDSLDEFEVVATAEDAYDAREKIKLYDPDLVTIDINMPKMNGVVFLKNLMRLRPMPSFVVSSEIGRDREVFEEGALAFIKKKGIEESAEGFIERVRNTLLSFSYLYDRYRISKGVKEEEGEQKILPDKLLQKNPGTGSGKEIIAIGASTGGVEALMYLFAKLPSNLPPIVVVQHIPYGFSKNFANRLDAISKVNVVETNETYELQEGCAYIAPGDKHILVDRCEESRKYIVFPIEGPKICYNKPSVNLLFRSVNNIFGKYATAAILTGMGDDGSIGIKELYENGAYTIAQSEESCVVFGMPKKAIECGAIKEVASLDGILEIIRERFKRS